MENLSTIHMNVRFSGDFFSILSFMIFSSSKREVYECYKYHIIVILDMVKNIMWILGEFFETHERELPKFGFEISIHTHVRSDI